MGLNKWGYRTTGRQVARVDQISTSGGPPNPSLDAGFAKLLIKLEDAIPAVFLVKPVSGGKFIISKKEDEAFFHAFRMNGVDWFEVEIEAVAEPFDTALLVEEVG